MRRTKTIRVTCPVCEQTRTLANDQRSGCHTGFVRCRGCAQQARRAAFAAERAARPVWCVHCTERRCARACGLCRDCFRVPELAARYAKDTPTRRRGPGQGMATPPLPTAPCYADPGSESKVAVMARRAANGQAVNHPDDCRVVVESWLGRSSRALSEHGSDAA
jgi:hypothetical protein